MECLIIENVRCFEGFQIHPIRPLTILVGENSSGKSTFLAATHYAKQLLHSITTLDFNEQPYRLGAYDQIAYYHGGQGKRADHFSIGQGFEIPKKYQQEGLADTLYIIARFESRASQPTLAQWYATCGPYKISAKVTATGLEVSFKNPQGDREVSLSTPAGEHISVPVPYILSSTFLTDKKPSAPIDPIATALGHLSRSTRNEALSPTIVSAPIRFKPLRTYDLTRDIPTPEGDHVPALLSQLKSASDQAKWTKLKNSLSEFGTASGILKQLDLKRKGSKHSDPFQIEVTVGKYPFNLLDVGYGVSQVLPILVDTLQSAASTRFLLQQPEVHLHPKAQAELGSFFAAQVSQGKHFIIETHSDYLIDRVLMDIRDKKTELTNDMLQLLYFERQGKTAHIHKIQVNEKGELIDAPPTYRSFFMREQMRFLQG